MMNPTSRPTYIFTQGEKLRQLHMKGRQQSLPLVILSFQASQN